MRPGTDAAWALAMCKVIIDEGIYDSLFVKDRTDLPLLVRTDNRCFLRGEDLEEGGGSEQFYFSTSGPVGWWRRREPPRPWATSHPPSRGSIP